MSLPDVGRVQGHEHGALRPRTDFSRSTWLVPQPGGGTCGLRVSGAIVPSPADGTGITQSQSAARMAMSHGTSEVMAGV